MKIAMTRTTSYFIFFAILMIFSPLVQSGQDHFLIIGGGYSPSGNQVSLEKNVVFFRKLLAESYPSSQSHDLYFADGQRPESDIQYMVPMNDIPKANRYMATIFGSLSKLNLRYRNSSLENVDGISDNKSIDQWFAESKGRIEEGDRLFIYATAHGGKSLDKKNKYNTRLYLWGGQFIDVKKLSSHIGSLPDNVDVIIVMVQCYSGGFSHLIFQEALESNKLTNRNICGFYSTVHNRVAAGCTPDINEKNYQEYSSHFWAAIRGKSRMDEDIELTDFDGDGRTSFAEAHAYTLIESKTIDIPVKTSDSWLRRFSKNHSVRDSKFLPSTPYYSLIKSAEPIELAILDGLSYELNISGLHKYDSAKKKSDQIQEQRKKLADESKQLSSKINRAKGATKRILQFTWPELNNIHSPESVRFLTDKSDVFVKRIENLKSFKELLKYLEDKSKVERKRLSLEKSWAKYQRFIRTLENVAYQAQLYEKNDAGLIAQYETLKNAESSFFGSKQNLVSDTQENGSTTIKGGQIKPLASSQTTIE